MNKKFVVYKHFSTFCRIEVEAESEDEAWDKADKLPIDESEIMGNLDPWEESDHIDEEDE